MTDTKPGADELRIAHILKQRGVGPDAEPAAVIPPKPTTRPRDWLDDILDAPPPPVAEPEPLAPSPAPQAPTKEKVSVAGPKKAKRKRRRKRPGPDTPRSAFDTRPPSPRQSLIEAWDRVPYRLKWLVQHAIAAAAGWRLGWVGWATDTAAWFAAGHWTSSSAWVLYVIGALVAALYFRTRSWRWIVACACAVPATSIVVGVLLYGTPHP